ncbi:MAG: ribosome-binding factor A, partial [Actinomycetota bacterium]|nr:ribosome-binding factor A [Actinomycetota bacterium]
VNEALREVIADELELIDDDELTLVTITGVKSQSDFRRAIVWFSALSNGSDASEIAGALALHRIRLQAAVARQLRLKRTPELVFESDPAIAVGTRVEDILRAIGPEDYAGKDDYADEEHADQEQAENERQAGDRGAAGDHRPPEGV